MYGITKTFTLYDIGITIANSDTDLDNSYVFKYTEIFVTDASSFSKESCLAIISFFILVSKISFCLYIPNLKDVKHRF